MRLHHLVLLTQFEPSQPVKRVVHLGFAMVKSGCGALKGAQSCEMNGFGGGGVLAWGDRGGEQVSHHRTKNVFLENRRISAGELVYGGRGCPRSLGRNEFSVVKTDWLPRCGDGQGGTHSER